MQFAVLTTDIFLLLFIIFIGAFVIYASRKTYYREVGRRIMNNKTVLLSLGVITLYTGLAILDSIHFQPAKVTANGDVLTDAEGTVVYEEIRSVLDTLMAAMYGGVRIENQRIVTNFEVSYSKPLARSAFDKKIITDPESGRTRLESQPLVAPRKHWLGTDKAGGDIFYQIVKGVRTAIIVGLVTTLIALPFAIILGILAGYFGGRIDDFIQFIYTTISSIPSILLIVSLIMIIDSKLKAISVERIIWRDDVRVFGICCILGLLGWAHLCRLLRAETLKIRELDYVQAARSLGAGHLSIILHHILPNVTHIILISFILNFSGLVMVEVILSYINIGVPSTVASWGRIIDGARAELGRDPMVTWPVWSSFMAMFLLVLAFNHFGDVVRDALDPRLRKS